MGGEGKGKRGAYLVKIILEGSTSTIARKSSFQRRRHRLLGGGLLLDAKGALA